MFKDNTHTNGSLFYGFHGDWDHISVCFQNTFVNHTEISWKIDHSMQIKFTIGNKNTCKNTQAYTEKLISPHWKNLLTGSAIS